MALKQKKSLYQAVIGMLNVSTDGDVRASPYGPMMENVVNPGFMVSGVWPGDRFGRNYPTLMPYWVQDYCRFIELHWISQIASIYADPAERRSMINSNLTQKTRDYLIIYWFELVEWEIPGTRFFREGISSHRMIPKLFSDRSVDYFKNNHHIK